MAGARLAAQDGAQPRHQFLARKGLDDVVVGARLQPCHALLDAGPPGQHQDRDGAVLAQGTGDVDAVVAGQPQIEDDRVAAPVLDGGLDLRAPQRRAGPVAEPAQATQDHDLDGRIVLDHQDHRRLVAGHRHPSPAGDALRKSTRKSIVPSSACRSAASSRGSSAAACASAASQGP